MRNNSENASGTVEPFALPNAGSTDSDGSINGIPLESAEPDSGGVRLNKRGEPDKRFSRGGSSRRNTSAGATGNTGKEKADGPRLPRIDIAAGAIKGIHDVSAWLLKIEELELDDDEAEKLANALIALGRYYPSVDVPAVAIAWMNLVTVGVKVYGPKVTTYKVRKANEKRAKLNRPVATMPNAAGM